MDGGCWQTSPSIAYLCEESAENVAPGSRRLLWHGGGAEAEDIPDHRIGDSQRYRGDGGTIHVFEDGDGESVDIARLGSPDELLISSFEFEKRFFEFVEGRASRGETPIYGHEDSWWQGLLKCTDKIDQQMCQRCGNHCESWDWDTSGYALLNSTELEIEDLYWMTNEAYISKDVILPLSICVQYDWWVCVRNLNENTGVQDAGG